MPQIPALTAIRGLAAWWVVLYHFREQAPQLGGALLGNALAHGYLAVDLFFTLSGFVIALNYSTALERLTARSYARFLGLRLARIYPLHFVMLLLYLANPLAILLFSHRADPGIRYDATYYLLSLVLLQNWGFVDQLAWNVPAWSISTEWAAYLMFPLLAWGVAPRLRAPAMALALVAGSLMLLSVGAVVSVPTLGAAIPTFGLFRCLTEFAAGAGLFWLFRHRPATLRHDGTAALLAAALLAAASIIWTLPDFLLIPPAFALLIYGLGRQPRWVNWLLGWRGLEWIGTISYSTYLVHYFVRDWIKFLLLGPGQPRWLALSAYLAATALASVLLYRLVEVPGRRSVRAVLGGSARRAGLAPTQAGAG